MNPVLKPATSITDRSVTILWPGETPRVVTNEHPNFQSVRQAVKDQDWDSLYTLSNPVESIKKFSEGRITVTDDEVLFNGVPLHGEYINRILNLMDEGFDISPMVKFLDKVQDNPSMVSRNELPLWLEASSLPLADDGDFYAYKVVTANFKDKFTGKMDNSVGSQPSMKRSEVDDDRRNVCSKGLHFAALDYIINAYGCRGDAVVVLKVNPANVVSIPQDYNSQKGRAWTYRVVDHIGYLGDRLEVLPKTTVHSSKNYETVLNSPINGKRFRDDSGNSLKSDKPFWNVLVEYWDDEEQSYIEETMVIQAYSEDHAEEKAYRYMADVMAFEDDRLVLEVTQQ